MKKQIVLSLAFLVAVSCVPMQAAQEKSTWTKVKNGAKIAVGVYLMFAGIKDGIVTAITFDTDAARAQADAEIERTRQAHLEGGETPEEFEEVKAMGLSLINWMPKMYGGVGIAFTAGGAALVYSGYQGLTEEEEPVKA